MGFLQALISLDKLTEIIILFLCTFFLEKYLTNKKIKNSIRFSEHFF